MIERKKIALHRSFVDSFRSKSYNPANTF